VGRDARAVERRAHGVDQVGRPELARGDVHRHAQRVVLPLRELAAGLVQDPGADRDDEPVALGERDEAQRPDGAVHRVAPAQQRLDAGELAGGQPDERLVDEVQLAIVERLAQAALELEALERAPAH
jgi:hypothetical protein